MSSPLRFDPKKCIHGRKKEMKTTAAERLMRLRRRMGDNEGGVVALDWIAGEGLAVRSSEGFDGGMLILCG